MFRGILIRLRPVTLLVVVLAIALGSVPMAAAAQANRQAAPSGLPATTTTTTDDGYSRGPTNPYYSVQTITLGDGTQVDQVMINGPPEPPPGTELERAPVAPSALNQPGAAASLPVPAYNWVFGCSAVSASMIGAYFDRNGLPNIYTGPGNGGVMPMDNSTVWGTWSDSAGETYPRQSARGFTQRIGRQNHARFNRRLLGRIIDSTATDPYITDGWTQHAWGDAFGDYMKTSQSAYGNPDGATYFYWYTNGTPLTCAAMESTGIADKDGTYGRKLFYEAHGYSVTECYNQKTDNTIAGGFSFARLQGADRRRVSRSSQPAGTLDRRRRLCGSVTRSISMTRGITMTHQMTWGGSYAGMALQSVSVVNPVISNPVPTITDARALIGCAGRPGFHADRQRHRLHQQFGGSVERGGSNDNDVCERHATDSCNHRRRTSLSQPRRASPYLTRSLVAAHRTRCHLW